MFHPLPIFVGLRYVRTRRQGFFVSFISWVSMLGVCVGVAALITIISVMNGFEGELRTRLVSLTAHATLEGTPGLMRDWRATAERARSVPGTAGVAPYADVQAMIGRAGHLQPVLLHGLDPAAHRDGLPSPLCDVVRRATTPDVVERTPSVQAFLEQLTAAQAADPPPENAPAPDPRHALSGGAGEGQSFPRFREAAPFAMVCP